MSRLIDANALIEFFGRPEDDRDRSINHIIDKAPTIDAVEVVRCRDCAHSSEIKGTPENWYYVDRVMHCKELRGTVSDDGISAVWRDGYCDDGKRKEEHNGKDD